jgi:murein DD-endopeptidase MepM/ murein hydrolase activator NlpD
MVSSGFDLDLPDEYQRRGPKFRAVGHGGVDLPQPRGTPVLLVPLEGQRADAVVVFIGELFGTTVITHHTLLEGGESRDYFVLFGHLDTIAPEVLPGVALAAERVVGFVGDSGSRGVVHLHLEVRRVRPGVQWTGLPAGRLLAGDVSVVVDPRNVLPLRQD